MAMPSASKKSYAVGSGDDSKQEIVYSEELGLAIEKPPNGLTLE